LKSFSKSSDRGDFKGSDGGVDDSWMGGEMEKVTSSAGERGVSQPRGDPDSAGFEEAAFLSSAKETLEKGCWRQRQEKNKINPVHRILEIIRPPQKFLIKWHRSPLFVKRKVKLMVIPHFHPQIHPWWDRDSIEVECLDRYNTFSILPKKESGNRGMNTVCP
jgi:hypothetical protein